MTLGLHDVPKEEQAAKSELPLASLLNAIVQNSPDVIIISNQSGKIIFVNDQSKPLLGYNPEELIGKNIELLVHNLFANHEESGNDDRQDTPHGKIAHKYPILKAFQKSGTEILVSVLLSTFPAVSGYDTLYQISIRDAKTRQEIEEQSLTQNIAMSAAANGIIITDVKGIIQWVNPAVSRMTGYSKKELIGEHTNILQSEKHSSAYYQELWETILAGETWSGHLICRRKDGSFYHEEQNVSPVFNEQGEIIRFISIKQDVSKRYEAERELKRANKEIRGQLAEITRLARLLRENNQVLDKEVQERTEELAMSHIALVEANRQLHGLDDLKSSFLGVITHELKTPLASTLFTLQLIERGFYNSMAPEEKELFEQLQSSLSTSKSMIDNLVKYANFIGKQGVLQYTPVNINALLSTILSTFHPKMERKNLKLTGSVSNDLPIINGDETRLADVLNELLENAIKFTSEGGEIHIRIWADNENVYLSIQDTGEGIAAEDLHRLWKNFSQIADPLRRGNIGLGLGLALVKHIVEAHHGEVWVKSELGVGSTFGFNLPIGESIQA